MSQSAEQTAEELEDALKWGRCPSCDGMKCEGFPQSCTCCVRCGNSEVLCTCCPDCLNDLFTCRCSNRIVKNWSNFHYCCVCPNDSPHQKGERCPQCCAYCKCCKQCGTTPCICCTTCGELRIKCKCYSARVLSHFMRRAVHYHGMCPCPNTAALLTFIKKYFSLSIILGFG